MTATVGGTVPTPPNNTSTFLRGDGTFNAPAVGSVEWTYLSKVTYAAASGAQSFTSLATHDNYKLVFNIKNASATDLTTYMTLNGVTASNYSYQYKTNITTGGIETTTHWKVIEAGGAFTGWVFGQVFFSGKHSQGFKPIYSDMVSDGAFTRSDSKYSISGALASDSNDVSSVGITITGVVSGTVELWYKDAQ